MFRVLKDYFYILSHPFESHSSLGAARVLGFQEVVSSSWIFFCLRSLFLIFEVYIGVSLIESTSFLSEWGYTPSIKPQAVALVWVLLGILLYPLNCLLRVKFWSFLISFFEKLFEKQAKKNEPALISRHALCADFFCFIPIFGRLISEVFRMIHFYAGLTRRLSFSSTQAVVAIMSPFLLIGVFVVFIAFQIYLSLALII